jgi:hypothetical protein
LEEVAGEMESYRECTLARFTWDGGLVVPSFFRFFFITRAARGVQKE